jgi:hypothetical protein
MKGPHPTRTVYTRRQSADSLYDSGNYVYHVLYSIK